MSEEVKEDVGRPTVMTPEVVAKLEIAFSNGATVTEACFVANISRNSYYDYLKIYPDFSNRVEDLQNSIKYQAKVNIKEKIFEGDVETSKWFAERKLKDEGFSARTELTGKDGEKFEPQPVLVKFLECEKRPEDNRNSNGVQKTV